MTEVSLAESSARRSLADLARDLPEGVQVTMVRKADQNVVPTPDLELAAGDSLLLVSDKKSTLADAARFIGRPVPGQLVSDRSTLDYIRVFVGKADLVGVPLAHLPMPQGFPNSSSCM